MDRKHAEKISNILKASVWHFDTLKAVRNLNLPDWAIGAGFVRNAVWDFIHEFDAHTPLSDIDVLYFDPNNAEPHKDVELEKILFERFPSRPWEVRNQARMHVGKRDQPYGSTADAMRYWLETPTCVGVRLSDDDCIEVIAPYGLSDLIEMKARPTSSGKQHMDQYLTRMRQKNWPKYWPRVRVEGIGNQV